MRLEAENLSRIASIQHGFFTRTGGVSHGLYASLNAGYGSGDAVEDVRENRRRIARALGAEEGISLCTAAQVHGREVAVVDAPWHWQDAPQADALVTRVAGVPIGALSADCVPILLADPQARIIAAVHAGWKGARAGVLEAAIHTMLTMGAQAHRICAAVGPAIGQDSYQVSAEFLAHFREDSPGNERFFVEKSGSHYFDIQGYVLQKLRACGVDNAECLMRDTCADEEHFFSFRRATLRNEPVYGRQVSAIMLTVES